MSVLYFQWLVNFFCLENKDVEWKFGNQLDQGDIWD